MLALTLDAASMFQKDHSSCRCILASLTCALKREGKAAMVLNRSIGPSAISAARYSSDVSSPSICLTCSKDDTLRGTSKHVELISVQFMYTTPLPLCQGNLSVPCMAVLNPYLAKSFPDAAFLQDSPVSFDDITIFQHSCVLPPGSHMLRGGCRWQSAFRRSAG